MNALAFIPAKGRSRRLPGKNRRLLLGKPLVAYTVEAAVQSGCFDLVWVSTDDDAIADIARQYGATPVRRGPELCGDQVRAKDVLLAHLAKAGLAPGVVAMLMPTAPLRTAAHVREAMEVFCAAGTPTLMSVCEYDFSPALALRVEGGLLRSYAGGSVQWVREEGFATGYHPNGAICLARGDYFLEHGTFLDDATAAYIMSRPDSTDIDTLEEFRLAEFYLRSAGLDPDGSQP